MIVRFFFESPGFSSFQCRCFCVRESARAHECVCVKMSISCSDRQVPTKHVLHDTHVLRSIEFENDAVSFLKTTKILFERVYIVPNSNCNIYIYVGGFRSLHFFCIFVVSTFLVPRSMCARESPVDSSFVDFYQYRIYFVRLSSNMRSNSNLQQLRSM